MNMINCLKANISLNIYYLLLVWLHWRVQKNLDKESAYFSCLFCILNKCCSSYTVDEASLELLSCHCFFIVIKVMNWTIFKYLSRISGYDLHSENLIFINISYWYLTSVLQISRLACIPFLFCLFIVILIWGFKCVFFFLHHISIFISTIT